jgi:hypothetical protein
MKWRYSRAQKAKKNVPPHKLRENERIWDKHPAIQKVFPSRLSFAISLYEFEQVMKYEFGGDREKQEVVGDFLDNNTDLSKAQKKGIVRSYGHWSQEYNAGDENYSPGYQFGE